MHKWIFVATAFAAASCAADDTDTESDTEVATDADTEAPEPCDFADIAGVWTGDLDNPAYQRLEIDALAEVGAVIGSNFLYLDGDDSLLCEFEMVCEDNVTRTVGNPVVQNPGGSCFSADYEFSLNEDGSLNVVFPDGEAPDYILSRFVEE